MSGIAAAVIAGGATLAAAGIGAYSASQASKAQQSAAAQQAGAATSAAQAQLKLGREQLAQQKELYEKAIGLQEPFRQAGLTAQNRLLTYLGLPGGTGGADFGLYNRDFGMSDFKTDPGYAFRMSEGMKALERSAAARGGLLSGATLKGVERFGQNLASEEYANAFNRYQAERAARINPLQAMLGQGQTATSAMGGLTSQQAQSAGQALGGMSNAYGQLGQNLGAAYGNMGQARASGYVGMGNAAMGAAQGLGNIANQYATNQMMMSMFRPNNFAAAGSPYSYGAGGYTGAGPFMPGIG